MTWYNKYRPLSFDDVVGQELVKQVLKNSLTQGKIKHSYLLTGPKGTGKTTMARIFANSLNDTSSNPQASLDIIEMDAASNTGIDDIRFLTEVAQVPPIAGKYKIYIIDEVHMLSKSAMNALLKILEEPPQYLIFLLATTNPEKLLPTVMSRLTKLTLSSHTIEGLVGRMRYIADTEGLTITDQALEVIANRSSGGQRDAINHLETVASFSLVSYDATNVSELLGLVNQALIQDVIEALANQEVNTEVTKQVAGLSLDGQLFLGQVFEQILNLSLEGNLDYDALINPLAEVISYQLPTLTPLTALAVLQSKIGLRVFQKTPQNTAQEKKPPSLKKKPDSEVKELEIKPIEKIITPSIASNPPIQAEPKEVPAESTESSQLTTSRANKFFQGLNHLPNTPPTLKMCLQDVQVISIKDEIINFTTSNGFFLNLINNPINQKFLKKELGASFGSGYVLSVSIRGSGAGIAPSIPNAQIEDRVVEAPAQKEIKPKIEKPTSNQKESEIFYEAYRSLKPGMENKGIEIHSPVEPAVVSQEMFDDLISDLDFE